MATTIDEFLVRLGIDPASVSTFLADVQRITQEASQETVNLQVTSNAGEVLSQVSISARQAGDAGAEATRQFNEGLEQAAEGANDLKKGLLAVSAAAGIIGALGFREAAEESRGLARANVILSLSTEELAVAQEELRATADQVGLSYAEISSVLFDVASAGFEGQDAIDATVAAAKAAVPAGIDVATAFNAIATAQTNFNITSAESADALVRTADITRGTLADVSDALGRIGPTAAAAGISLEDIGAGFALITNRGENAAVASTLLFNAINSILGPTKEAREALERIGITTGDAAFQTQDLATKLELLRRASEEGRIELAKTFNIRAARGFRPLIGATEEFRENLDKIRDSAGRTDEGINAFLQSAGPQFDQLTKQITNAATAIGADLLEALLPVIKATTAFIKNNRTLIKILVNIGLVLAALTTTYLVFRAIQFQVAAAQKVINGLILANRALLDGQSVSLLANAKAWFAKLTAERAAASSPIVRALKSIGRLLLVENSVLAANIGLWIKKIALGIIRFLGGIAFAIGGVIAGLLSETKTLVVNNAAWRANIVQRSIALRGLIKLWGVLTTGIGSLSLLTTAIVGVGTAILGWKLGSAINDWLQLEKATAAYVKTGKESAAATLANVVTFGALDRERAKAIEAQSEINTLNEAQLKALRQFPGAFDEFRRSMELGFTVSEAFGAAMGNVRQALAALNRLEKQNGKLTAEQLTARIGFENDLLRIQEERTANQIQSLRLNEALARSQEIIAKQQERWKELVKDTNKEFAKLQVGGLAESLDVVDKFSNNFDLIRERFNVFIAQLAELESQRASLQEKTGKGVEQALAKNAVEIETQVRKIQDVRTQFVRNIEITSRRIIQLAQDEVDVVRTKGEEEFQAFKRVADKEVEVEKKKVDDIKREIERLNDIRDAGIAAAEDFIRRLEFQELRRRDTALADIIQLERDYNEAIKDGIASDEQRTRALAAFNRELTRLAEKTQEEIRLEQQLQQVGERLAEARRETESRVAELREQQVKTAEEARRRNEEISEERQRSGERISDLLSEQQKLEQRLTEEQEKRTERALESQRISERAEEASQSALQEFQQREEEIADLESQREQAQLNIERAAERIRQKEAEIAEEVQKQVNSIQEFAKTQLQVVENSKKVIAAIEESRQAEAKVFTARVKEAESGLKEALDAAREATTAGIEERQTIEQEVEALSKGSTEIADWVAELRSEFDQVADAVKQNSDAIVPAAQELTTAFAGLDDGLAPAEASIEEMLRATQQFAPQLESFGETVVDKVGETARTLDRTTARVAALESQLEGVTVDTGGGANGLIP